MKDETCGNRGGGVGWGITLNSMACCYRGCYSHSHSRFIGPLTSLIYFLIKLEALCISMCQSYCHDHRRKRRYSPTPLQIASRRDALRKSRESTDSARAGHNLDTPAVHPVESGLPEWF